MKCHEARELLIHYSNGEVSRSERELLQSHLSQCESCFRHMQALGQVEDQLRQGLHDAAADAEPSAAAWQALSHKLAQRRGSQPPSHQPSHQPLPLVWRLMGGLSAAVAFAILVGSTIVAPALRDSHPSISVMENELPSHADALDPALDAVSVEAGSNNDLNAPAEANAGAQSDPTGNTHNVAPAPQRQTRTLIKSEPDAFLPKSQVRDEPELEFMAQTNCVYCLKMR